MYKMYKMMEGGVLSIIGGLRGNYISADAPAERAKVKIDGNKVTYEINYIKKLNFHFFKKILNMI